MITYTDTRGQVERQRLFSEVILEGIAPGGGLFVPERLPAFDVSDVVGLAALPYRERAARVFEAFGLDVGAARIREITAAAYASNFDDPAIAPVRRVGDHFVLELWHGPTLAFKDMALQCMPLFFSEALETAQRSGRTKLDYLILVATSGDTGVAALNGYADRAHTRICVYYPDAGVSAMQERQMITQPGDNLTVFRLDGDFDACQSAVKAVFDDADFAGKLADEHRLALSSANSINWGRLLPQIVYYASAYADMVAGGHLGAGDPLDVCVPTGNFGNILAAYYAQRCGVPIRRLLCASNANKVLTDFITTGDYDISGRRLIKTPSPSMDILISSNLERLLYDLVSGGGTAEAADAGSPDPIGTHADREAGAASAGARGEAERADAGPAGAAGTRGGAGMAAPGSAGEPAEARDGGRTPPAVAAAEPGTPAGIVIGRWMAELKGWRRFSVDGPTREKLRQLLEAAWVDNDTSLHTLGEVYGHHDYLIDPHTAVAWKVAQDLQTDAPVLTVSTAHWSKFAADVMRGLTGTACDQPLPHGTDARDLGLLDEVVRLASNATVPPQLRAVRERPIRFRERVEGSREALENSLRRWLSSSAR